MPTFLGYPIVCNNFTTCRQHRACRDFTNKSLRPAATPPNDLANARRYRERKATIEAGR